MSFSTVNFTSSKNWGEFAAIFCVGFAIGFLLVVVLAYVDRRFLSMRKKDKK